MQMHVVPWLNPGMHLKRVLYPAPPTAFGDDCLSAAQPLLSACYCLSTILQLPA